MPKLTDQRYHVIVNYTGGVIQWLLTSNPALKTLKLDFESVTEDGIPSCPVCGTDLTGGTTEDRPAYCPECQVDWSKDFDFNTILAPADNVLVTPRPTQWKIIQANLVLDSNGVYWVYGDDNLRVVGDNDPESGEFVVSFEEGVWFLLENGYLECSPAEVEAALEEWRYRLL